MKELERERMLRADTEQRLQDMRVESDSCRARLHALQQEFRKMEEMVRDMLQYKTKIDQLKQEKSNLAVTYENNLQKCRNHISTLERENMMLLNQVKKMESQIHGKGDDRDKSRLLLERLKMVEAENSGLVLENEQQRQQYEKCLDQIANQVVQALLAQKTLREECMKLQSRVQDLEAQNQQLNLLFQQRIRFPSDPTMQHMPFSSSAMYVCRAEAGQGEVTSAQFLQGSAVSLQSMFSELMVEDSPGHPQMSTPPPWLRDRLELPLDDDISLSSSSSGSPASPHHPCAHPLTVASVTSQGSPGAIPVPVMKTRIETEFPATNSSPKMKHISVLERGTQSLERRGAGFTPLLYSVGPSRGSTGSVIRTRGGQGRGVQGSAVKHLSSDAVVPAKRNTPVSPAPVVGGGTSVIPVPPTLAGGGENGDKLLGKKPPSPPTKTTVDKKLSPPKLSPPRTNSGASGSSSGNGMSPKFSPLSDKVKLRPKGARSCEASRSPHRNSLPSSMAFHSQYYYDYSDEDSDSRPVSRVFSSASTVSLNELLDTSGEGDLTLDDDFFSDWSSMCLSPQHRLPIQGVSPQHRLTALGQSPLVASGLSPGMTQGQSTHTSPCIKMGVQSLTPLIKVALHASDGARVMLRPDGSRQTVPGGVKAERDDSGCEVDSSHTDLNSPSAKILESAEVNVSERGKKGPALLSATPTPTQLVTHAVVTVASSTCVTTGAGNKIVYSASDELVVHTSDGSRYSVQSAKTLMVEPQTVHTVSASKAATRVQLPPPQHGVLLACSASKSDPKQPGHVPSPDLTLTDSSPESINQPTHITSSPFQGNDATNINGSPGDNVPSSSLKTSTDMPFSSDLVASVISREAFGCKPKLMSQPLTTEEKTRACRPDQLILAPADKHFSFRGFTSASSSSCEERSHLKIAHVKPLSATRESDAQSAQAASDTVTSPTVASPMCPNFKPKKTPPPVPKKPAWSPVKPVAPSEIASVGEKGSGAPVGDVSSEGSGGGVGGVSGGGVFPVDNTVTVGFMTCAPQNLDNIACHPDTVRNYVNCLVKDMKERVARQCEWTATGTTGTTTITSTTSTLNYCKSLDSSFESLRAERSGSKDDGYSTMSSDIHPAAMEKFAYADTIVSKPAPEGSVSGGKGCEVGQVTVKVESQSLKKRDKSIETSDPDSAMETSTHSMDTRTSSQSLSSQISSSSGENVLSPVSKVTRMARFFEDEAVKTSKCGPTFTSATTPSPLSPLSSITSPDSSDGHLGADTVQASPVSSPTKLSHGRWGSSSHGSSSSVVSVTCNQQVTNTSPAIKSPLFSSSCSPCTPLAEESCGGGQIKDSCGGIEKRLKPVEKAVSPVPHDVLQKCVQKPVEPSSFPVRTESDDHSSPQKDMPNTLQAACPVSNAVSVLGEQNGTSCSPRKENILTSPRKENALSWPPRKQLSTPTSPTPQALPPPPSPVTEDLGVASGWTFTASPLHITEDKFLDDIPEESCDEWDNLYTHTIQELQQQNQQHKQQRQQQRSAPPHSRGTAHPAVQMHGHLKKAKSESSLCEKLRADSLYDEMMSGSWDSGKVLERSASVSEMDCRSQSQSTADRATLHRSAGKLSLDEVDVDHRVALIIGKSVTKSVSSEESEGETEAKKQLNNLWNTLMAQHPVSLPSWTPRQMAEEFKKTCTPSPSSVKKMDGSRAEDWLLSFTKEEIDKHTTPRSAANAASFPAKSRPSRGVGWDSKRVYGLDLSHFVQPGTDEDRSLENEREGVKRDSTHASVEGLNIDCHSSHVAEDGESSECSPRSPSAEQKLFHSEFYSLCLVESNRSLITSSMEGMHEYGQGEDGDSHDPNSFQARLTHPSYIREGIHVREFDEISSQIANLTRTVNELSRSLNSLNSGESGDSTHDLRSSGVTDDYHGEGASGDAASAKRDYVDGYHWVEDEFYVTSCGGEVIIGSSALLDEEGLDDFCEGGAGEEGGLFHLDDNDDEIADDAQDDFYCIRIPQNMEGKASFRQQARPSSGYLESEQVLASLAQFRYNSDGQLDRQNAGNSGTDLSAMGWRVGTSSSQTSLSHLHPAITSRHGKVSDENLLADGENRANLLDSMLPSGESNDSLSSDIGLDHMMCQRLMGRKGKLDVVRFALPKQRPTVDFSKFFIRYGSPEQDAVAAFDFLEDIATSDSGSEILAESRRLRSASHPLSRDVVIRQAEARRSADVKQADRSPRPLSESDFAKFRLPDSCARSIAVPPSEHRPSSFGSISTAGLQFDGLRMQDVRSKTGFGMNPLVHAATAKGANPAPLTPPPKRHRLRRRRKKVETKDKSQSAGVTDGQDKSQNKQGAAARTSASRKGRGSRGKKGGEKLHSVWHDIKVGDAIGNTLSLSDSCCDSGSSSSSPSSPCPTPNLDRF